MIASPGVVPLPLFYSPNPRASGWPRLDIETLDCFEGLQIPPGRLSPVKFNDIEASPRSLSVAYYDRPGRSPRPGILSRLGEDE